tara:strand:+ start:176 stop:625 length:450 start_codon:yes stop_codon:yes gene_type:complete
MEPKKNINADIEGLDNSKEDIKETKSSNLSVWQKAKDSANETKRNSFSKALDDFSHLSADERKKIDSEINRIVNEKTPEVAANFFLIIIAILFMLIGLLFTYCTFTVSDIDKVFGGTGNVSVWVYIALITIALVSFGAAIAIIKGMSKK